MKKNDTNTEKNNTKNTYQEYYDMGLKIIEEDAEYVNKSKNKNLIRFKGQDY